MAMAVFAAIAFATFLLEHDYFVAFHESSSNFAYYFSAFDGGSTHSYSAVIVDQQNAVEFHGVTFLVVFTEEVNIQEAVLFSFELLTLNFYDNVHYNN